MMRERARAAGASLRITSRHEHGTRVAVKWAEEKALATATQGHSAAGRARHRGER